MRPVQRLAVDIFLQQTFAHHQAEILARPPPWRVGGFIDDVPEIVEAAGIGRLAGGKPRLARLPALPGAGSETENFDLDAATPKVRARISAQVAATVMGRPRIEPELSGSNVTTVSRKVASFSCM